MKKYYLAGTDNEIQFGEMLELDFTRDGKCGVTHHHMECKFIPELVDMLLENEIIEVEDDEDEEDECCCEFAESAEEALEAIGEMQEVFHDLLNRLAKLEADVEELKNPKPKTEKRTVKVKK